MRTELECRRPEFRDGGVVAIAGQDWTIPRPIYRVALRFTDRKARAVVGVDLLESGPLADAYQAMNVASDSDDPDATALIEAGANFIAAALALNYEFTDQELEELLRIESPDDLAPIINAVTNAVLGITPAPKPSPVGSE